MMDPIGGSISPHSHITMYGIFPDGDWSPEEPNTGDDLWRYIDFSQFISLIESQELWLSSVANFFDPFEGALSEAAVQDLANRLPDGIAEPERIVRVQYDALRYMTYANCWHCRDRESGAMWQLYRGKGKEVAIRTTLTDLLDSLPGSQDLTTGCVEYEDYDTMSDFAANRVSPFFHKRPSFSHEHEYRIVLSEFEVADGAPLNSKYIAKIDSETPEGKTVPVDPDQLIQEVIVSPVAGGWLVPLLEDVFDTYGLDGVTIRQSNISKEPY